MGETFVRLQFMVLSTEARVYSGKWALYPGPTPAPVYVMKEAEPSALSPSFPSSSRTYYYVVKILHLKMQSAEEYLQYATVA